MRRRIRRSFWVSRRLRFVSLIFGREGDERGLEGRSRKMRDSWADICFFRFVSFVRCLFLVSVGFSVGVHGGRGSQVEVGGSTSYAFVDDGADEEDV